MSRSIRVCRTPGVFTPDMERGFGYWPPVHNIYARIDPAQTTQYQDGWQASNVVVEYPWSDWDFWGTVDGGFEDEPLYRDNCWFGAPGLEFNEDRRLDLGYFSSFHKSDEMRPWFQVVVYVPIGGLRSNGCRIFNTELEAHDGTLDLNTEAGNFTDVVTLNVPNVVGVGVTGYSYNASGQQDYKNIYVITRDLEMNSASDVDGLDHNRFDVLGQSSTGGAGWSDKWQLLEYVMFFPNPDGAYELMGFEYGDWGKMVVDHYRRKWSAW
ncbi:MAG: hypothetical protein ACXAB9_05375 [Candidatus Thorarchaeota archaeon]